MRRLGAAQNAPWPQLLRLLSHSLRIGFGLVPLVVILPSCDYRRLACEEIHYYSTCSNMKKLEVYQERLRASAGKAQKVARGLLNGFAALFVPSKWAHTTIHTFLNAADAKQRDELTTVFITSTLSTMSTTSLVVRFMYHLTGVSS